MIFATLDSISRRYNLERGLPLHYYLESLLHASTCLREMSIDTLKVIRTVELPVNSYFAVDLPDDFVDDVGLAIPVGGLLQPIPKREGLSPLRVHDNTGNFIAYDQTINVNEVDLFAFNTNWLWYWNINDYGEPTGRYFGSPGAGRMNGWQVFKERRQIQLTNTFTSPTIVLMYISDGQSSDNATQVELMAIKAIQSYIDWQRSHNAAIKDSPEARTFYSEKRKVRARMDDLTVADIRQCVLKSYNATMKN